MPYGGFGGTGSTTRLSINRQNGAYTLQSSDVGRIVLFEGQVDATYTLPSGFSEGDVLTVESSWAANGALTILPDAGIELSLCEPTSFGPVASLLQVAWPARLVLVHLGQDRWDAAGANFSPQ